MRHFRRISPLAASVFVLLAAALNVPAADPNLVLQDPTVQAAFAAIKRNEPSVLDEQARVTAIPAPAFKEEVRARYFAQRFKELGLQDVRIDKEGNVLGVRPGLKAKPNIVLAAHLDTVFPEGTDVTVKREGRMLKAPGIGDDGRGLAALIAVIRGLNDGGVQTTGTLTFVANVGEEGLGDLRGVKALFNDTLKGNIDAFISIDGTDVAKITTTAVGSYRYRITFHGPGGHSYGAFGLANPLHAMGRAIGRISDIEVPKQPKTTFNVGRVGGGTSVNSVPFEAWMEVDMRSADPVALDAVRDKILAAVKLAAQDENARWHKTDQVTAEIVPVGVRPAGNTPGDTAIVQIAQSGLRALGHAPSLGEGSTDSNIPMSLGIPAVTIGGGGKGEWAHSLSESYDSTDSWQGPQAALLLVVSLAR